MDTQLNIVVVEDHDALREITVEALSTQGHEVVGVPSVEALDGLPHVPHPDLMVIDLNLPGEDGLSLSRRVRARQPEVGIIMVTARTQLGEKMRGYESGADIYLTKPTSVEELGAAVQALGRRLKGSGLQVTLRVDPVTLALQGPGGIVHLTSHEAGLLEAFTAAPLQRLENRRLLEFMGRGEVPYRKASLEVQLARLRKKLLQAGALGQPLKAIRQFGYQLCTRITVG